MSILDAMIEIRSGWRPLNWPLPPVSRTERKMQEIVTSPPRPLRPPVDLDNLHARLMITNADGNWNRIQEVEYRYLSECLSMGNPPLVADDRFVARYLSKIEPISSPMLVKRLVRYYLIHYSPVTPGFRRIATYITDHITECGVWEERHHQHRLFDVNAAPGHLAATVMASEVDPQRSLSSLGFTGTLARSNILAEAFGRACWHFRKHLEQHNPRHDRLTELRRIVAWASPHEMEFAFGGSPAIKKVFVEALLMPWANQTPTDEMREFITTTLIGMFQDPRLRPGAWSGIPEEALSILRRWLTKASLEQFIAVVDEVVTPDRKHMWNARKKFWRAYYDHDFMQEAWVVLGKRGIQSAKKLKLEYGSFASGSIQDQTQALLIMRIGTGSTPPLLVADWSHNGFCHIWLDDAKMVPKLYKSLYRKGDLNHESTFKKRHAGAWQDDVAEFIRSHTGIKIH
ncbi:MAG: EH signature domain-containing protein [Magnetococcus sp. YQC-5]